MDKLSAEEFAYYDYSGMTNVGWAIFAGNIFCGHEATEERAKLKVDALNEAAEAYASRVSQAADQKVKQLIGDLRAVAQDYKNAKERADRAEAERDQARNGEKTLLRVAQEANQRCTDLNNQLCESEAEVERLCKELAERDKGIFEFCDRVNPKLDKMIEKLGGQQEGS